MSGRECLALRRDFRARVALARPSCPHGIEDLSHEDGIGSLLEVPVSHVARHDFVVLDGHHLVPPGPLGPSRRMSQDALRVSSKPAKDRSTARKLSESGTTYEARLGPG